MNENMRTEIGSFFKGEMAYDAATLTKYSHDASLLEVQPELILYPSDVDDLKNLVNFAMKEKGKGNQKISITGRSAGTDMSGGPLNESIILDFTRHFNHKDIDLPAKTASVEPGVFFRDFEAVTVPSHIVLPVYPASKSIAALGGMIMNNAGGEKTLRYGQVRDFVNEVSMVLADGNEYRFGKLTRAELEVKMAQTDFEGDVYRRMYDLITRHHDTITASAPKTSKNSSGYALWRIWQKGEIETFDLSQLFVGSQGTLGLMTRANIRLIEDTPHRKLIAIFFKSWDDLPAVVNALLPFDPESMEVFDDTTIKLGIRFMPDVARAAHENFFRFAARFLPEAMIGVRMLGLPKLVVLVELAESDEATLSQKITAISKELKEETGHPYFRVLEDGPDAEKYWVMRRESFNLLRKHIKGKRTAPFIEDFAIDPDKMPEFLPKLLKILKDNDIVANIAGHAGNGNYHIIPLMDLSLESERAKIVPVAELVYNLIIQYGGSITAEHNDGIVRTPFLEKMFGEPMYHLFEQVKQIFDPQNIFNPGKKVGGSLEYFRTHIRK